jgi:TolB protein
MAMVRVILLVLMIAMTADGAEFAARTSYCPQWHPDGKQLVFYSEISGRWRILKINVDGSNLTMLSQVSEFDDFYPSFSPKGDRILFYSNRDKNQEIYSMGADGSDVKRLTFNTAADRYPRWSLDGSKIGYVCDQSEGKAICVMNADGSEQRRITNPEKVPVVSRISWSPDGSKIIFYSSSDKKEMSEQNQWTLFEVSIATHKVVRLDPAWRRDSNPDSSRAKNKIAVDANKNGSWESGDGGWEIFVTNADGTGRRNLTNNENRNDWGPSWSPDGKSIAYSSGMNDQYEIHIIDASGNAPRQITRLLAEESFIDARDSRSYPVVRLGTQLWMARNVAFSTNDSSCYQNAAACDESGRLYTWDAALQACPDGWHLPTDEEWIALETHLGMSEEDTKKTGARGKDQGANMRSGGSSGLQMPISGYRRPTGEFVRAGERAAFWTATEANQEDAWHRDIRSDVGTVYRSPVTKTYALSVRCIRSQQ